MIPNRVWWASVLAFVLQGTFILTARYRLSYDAYNHMFFGDHYLTDWWTLWEPRWYTGFPVTSYPPLTHQLIGLIGHLTDVDTAFALILWAVLTAFPLAIYAFSRIFFGKSAAGYAALGAAVLPSLYQAAHTFGQLPTLFGALFALFGVSVLNEYLLRGERLSAALTVSLFTVMMASHHATLLFLPWMITAVLLHIYLNQKPGWPSIKVIAARMAGIGFLSILTGFLVIWPFWVWGLGQSLQAPIDHISRHNYFVDLAAPVIFFLPAYGPLIAFIPFVLWQGLRKKYFGLWFAFLMLFLLGLGDTTPLPRWLFGAGWEWLTYDRFILWASLVMLPFLGWMIISIRKRIATRQLNPSSGGLRIMRLRRLFILGLFLFFGFVSIISGLLPTLLPTQPVQIDMQPIVDFLAQADHSQWRYVTFGLGDQLAYLSRLTTATTIDGSYHTARMLPELRTSGIGQIDTTYWLPDGLSRLDPILQQSSLRGVRWGFVNRDEYIPILERNGWDYHTTLRNNIQVWENPHAILPLPSAPPVENPIEQFSWGVFPLFSLLLVAALAALRQNPARAQKILFGLHAFFIGLLPLGLCFWYYRTLVVIAHPRVYFTYDNALLFLSDALAWTAFLVWALGRGFGPDRQYKPAPSRHPMYMQPSSWIVGLCLLSTLSCLWSRDWRTSLYSSLHLWTVFGLFLSLEDRPDTWRPFAVGSFFALLVQVILGFWQFGVQTTAFLQPLGLNWPGTLVPSTNGASVVQLADGVRWLRIYGTLPHPNILGGVTLVFLAGLIILFLKSNRQHILTLSLFTAGVTLLTLTFSRSAWLGFVMFALILALKTNFPRNKTIHIPENNNISRMEERASTEPDTGKKRLVILFIATLMGLAIAIIPLWELVFTRLGNSTIATESYSINARTYLARQGLIFFSEHPFTGIGIGSFIIQLSQRASYGYLIEPVHNVLLLVLNELGIAGAITLLGLILILFLRCLPVQQPPGIVFTALLAGLFVISLFDHYVWTLAPGRMLAGLVLGLWSSQIKREDPAEKRT